MRQLIAALLLASAPAAAQTATQPAPAMAGPAAGTGYLTPRPAQSLLRLLPPPPEPGSPEARAEIRLYKDSRRGIGGPLWNKAVGQLSVTSPAFVQQLSCALGAKIGPQTTPATMAILRRAGADLGPAINAAKEYYKRPRPFTMDRGKACDPDSAVDGGKALGFSYPSGHAAVGWLWGLILADIRPERSAALLHFGKQTGDLRMACRVHYLSDVTHGRLFATGLYQAIADHAEYKADISRAAAELSLAPVPEGCPAS
ncbi:phosphatase PAP2 family protein [Sandarakinorhabdus rubra]|uniref:phosphatase PAP2 family protein n=1 Tax=Sandarakinorhabdus rubra TaxID=2672568 RepID=UPI0013DCB491|nr:phosphatase PAP2 family protein [Sandarakinorhabdus rubra]